MSVVFPPSWENLRFPHVRAELIEYLRSASDPTVLSNTSEVEFIVHFVLDDHDLVGSHVVGDVLLNSDEALAVSTFVKALEDAIGPPSKKLSSLKARDWDAVPAAAIAAHALLMQSGTPTYD